MHEDSLMVTCSSVHQLVAARSGNCAQSPALLVLRPQFGFRDTDIHRLLLKEIGLV